MSGQHLAYCHLSWPVFCSARRSCSGFSRTVLPSEEPEKLLFLKLLSAYPIFSFASDAGLTYAWPRESDFLYDPRSYSKDSYLAPLQKFLLPLLQAQIPGLSPVLPQKLALIMILCRLLPNLNNRDRGLFTKEEIFPDYMQLLTRILSYVDEEIKSTARCFLPDMY